MRRYPFLIMKQPLEATIYYRLRDISQLKDPQSKLIEFLGEYKPRLKRTSSQNRALHLLFTEISNDCMAKGIEMRQLVRDEVPIQATPENIKWLWKLLQEALFKTKSTTELEKTGQIETVYDNFNSILIERTKGEICLPPFPHDPDKTKDMEELQTTPTREGIDYPKGDYETKF